MSLTRCSLCCSLRTRGTGDSTRRRQVFAWGDNDHGQQGNGTTQVNRKPTLVHDLEGVRVSRVACGSSHSVAWTTAEPSAPAKHEPVLFPSGRDPLGADTLSATSGLAAVLPAGAAAVRPSPAGAEAAGAAAAAAASRGRVRQVSLARSLLMMESQAGQKVRDSLVLRPRVEGATGGWGWFGSDGYMFYSYARN